MQRGAPGYFVRENVDQRDVNDNAAALQRPQTCPSTHGTLLTSKNVVRLCGQGPCEDKDQDLRGGRGG